MQQIITKKKYKSTGALFGDEKAQVYGEELEKIAAENGGVLTPDSVVKAAENEDSPLHDHFDWNDSSAAEKFRLAQARQMINHIEITVTIDGDEIAEQRAFMNVMQPSKNGKSGSNVYVTVEKAMTSKEYRKQILATAMREAKYWEEKYKEYNELSEVFSAIDITAEDILDE